MAWIEGRQAGAEEALDAAARLLRESRLPVLTGGAGDVDTVRALVGLARRCGGILDHDGFEAAAPMLAALREAGIMLGAPAEMRRRADRYLLLGPDPFAGSPALRDYLFSGTVDLGRAKGATRCALWIGAEAGACLPGGAEVLPLRCAPKAVGRALATIRAAVNGRRHADGPLEAGAAAQAAAFLRGAAFGCVVFAPAAFDALDVELVCGLVEDLNRETRFACLPVHGPDGAFGAAQVAAWLTGFPLRTAFGGAAPDFDPILNAAARRIAAGEADLALHVAGADAAEPRWSGSVPVITLGDASGWRRAPRVAFAADAATPGGRIVFEPRFGSFVPEDGEGPADPASRPAAILAAIAARLGEGGR